MLGTRMPGRATSSAQIPSSETSTLDQHREMRGGG